MLMIIMIITNFLATGDTGDVTVTKVVRKMPVVIKTTNFLSTSDTGGDINEHDW